MQHYVTGRWFSPVSTTTKNSPLRYSCMGSCKSNYHAITATTTPGKYKKSLKIPKEQSEAVKWRKGEGYIVAVSFIGGENRSTWRNPPICRKSLANLLLLQLYRSGEFFVVVETGENHRPVVSQWQTLLYNVVHLVLIEIRTHNISGDRHCLHSSNFCIRLD
jgi:hypothetical protein